MTMREKTITISSNNKTIEYICDIFISQVQSVYLYRENGENASLLLLISNEDGLLYGTPISFSQIDHLNQGKITLDLCFYGIRKTPKRGFVLKRNDNQWLIDSINDIGAYYQLGNISVPEFVENNHGVGLLTLVYKAHFLSLTIDKSDSAQPLVDADDLKRIVSSLKGIVKSIPFNIKKSGKIISFSDSHSVRACIEIGDIDDDKDMLTDKRDLKESDKALDLLTRFILGDSLSKESIDEIADLCDGNKSFATSMQKNIAKLNFKTREKAEISLTKYSDEERVKTDKRILDDDMERSVLNNSIQIINSIEEKTKKSFERHFTGYFEMIDTTGTREFKFKTMVGDSPKTIRGRCSVSLDDKQIDLIVNNRVRKYDITVVQESNLSDNKSIDVVYSLIDLEIAKNDEQLSLFNENKE